MTVGEQARLNLDMQVTLRPASASDLPKLEWFGQYLHFRRMFRRTFAEQQRGRRLMLVADCGGFPIGQVFLHFNTGERRALGPRMYMYSLRVMEMFRGRGIGSALIAQAEHYGLLAGSAWAGIAVAKDNAAAQRLYERLGYTVFDDDEGIWTFLDHRGRLRRVSEPCWLLEKPLDLRYNDHMGEYR